MGWLGNHRFEKLDDLLVQQLEDLYDAEKRLTQALPKMAEAARSPHLQSAFREHLDQTEGHIKRLETTFEALGRRPERETCQAMKGLISEGEEMISAEGDDGVRDAALIAAAQRVEHYEISSYGTARNFAQRLGLDAVAQTLQSTLDEEKQTDERLNHIAEQTVNVQAKH